jgi:hypothetical protein
MDNIYYKFNCPPLMSDGRFLTNYVRMRRFDQDIRNINNIQTSQEYKTFLQNNTNTILEREQNYIISNNTCKCNDNK